MARLRTSAVIFRIKYQYFFFLKNQSSLNARNFALFNYRFSVREYSCRRISWSWNFKTRMNHDDTLRRNPFGHKCIKFSVTGRESDSMTQKFFISIEIIIFNYADCFIRTDKAPDFWILQWKELDIPWRYKKKNTISE